MPNTNEKIIILEKPESSPRGAGASSDIAYVPGITCGKPEYANVPTLCNTLADLQLFFGTDEKGQTVTAKFDGKSEYKFGEHLFNPDDTDISYLYATELLNAGISVYYEAIVLPADEETALATEKTNLTTTIKTLNSNLSTAKEAKTTEEGKTKPDAAVIAELNKKISEYESQIKSSTDRVNEITKILDMSNVEYLYNQLPDRFAALNDKGAYSIKYITSGGYPTFTDYSVNEAGVLENDVAMAQLAAAKARGDAVALIDHGDNKDKALGATNPDSIYKAVNIFNWGTDGSYGAMFTPWATYSCPKVGTVVFPASFGYLMCLAKAVKTSPNWLAMAGITRGQVPYIQSLNTKYVLSNMIAEDYQPRYGADGHNVSMNAITNIRPYGLTLWGNRTLEKIAANGTTALAALNTRNMVSDIKKVAYNTATELMFEQDGEVLWNRFKAGISPLLDQIRSGYGISKYSIIRNKTKANGNALDRGELSATIRIYPINPIEYFEITVAVADEDVSVS